LLHRIHEGPSGCRSGLQRQHNHADGRNGAGAAASFTLLKERTYHLVLHDSEGTSSVDPVEYRIQIVPDAYPTVAIPVPGMNLDVTDNTSLDMVIKAGDDYGFSRWSSATGSSSRCMKRRGGVYRSADSHPGGNGNGCRDPLPVGSPESSPCAGGHGELQREVFDNDVVSGPKSAISETFTLRLPSLDEVFADVEKQHDAGVDR